MKQRLYLAGSILMLIFMLMFPAQALSGAKNGLQIWYQSLLPSLFPYTMLCSLILGLHSGEVVQKVLSPIGTRLFGITGYGCFALFAGMLCGYPIGARITAQLVRNGQLDLKEGQYLLSFCNNASPGFLVQFMAIQCLGDRSCIRPFLLSVYGAAFLTACSRRLPGLHKKNSRVSTELKAASVSVPAQYSVNDAIMESFEAVVRLGGYLVLFSIIVKMVTGFITAVTTFDYFLIGVIEITNGVYTITGSSMSMDVKLLLLSFCVSFGGLSCFAQSMGMCQGSGLSMKLYFAAKLQNGILAVMLMFLWLKITKIY